VHAGEAHFRIASLLQQQGATEEALANFHAVIDDETAPAKFRSEGIYRAGRCEQTLKQTDAAITTYTKALPLRPENDSFRLAALAELAQLVEERDPAQALTIYRELAATSTEVGVRAVAVQRLAVLTQDAAVSKNP
jgi:tetratricopeptide (TPR) repeat protein